MKMFDILLVFINYSKGLETWLPVANFWFYNLSILQNTSLDLNLNSDFNKSKRT